MLIADQQQVFGACAEGGDACIVHTQMLFAQDPRDIRQQPGAIGTDQANAGATGKVDEIQLWCHFEMFEMTRLAAPCRQHSPDITHQCMRQCVGQSCRLNGLPGIHGEYVKGVVNRTTRRIQHPCLLHTHPQPVQCHHDGGKQPILIGHMHQHFQPIASGHGT